ncbi:cytochrome P450 [Gaetbulibacter aestuarii]|uniref:Cytochrome P450 n=1 Tax=Gaetbulibacter aestuarii TaxID=1502358 RepID=A0ABW7N0K6_9FLAO
MNKKNIPTVSSWEFLMNSYKIIKNPLPFHLKKFKTLGENFKVKAISVEALFSRDVDLADYVLKKNQKNYTKTKVQTENLSQYVGKGLLTSEGEHWRKQRKLIQPAFHKKQLIHLLESIEDAIISEFKNIEEEKLTNIFPILNDLAFNTVVQSLFSNAANPKQIKRLQWITENIQKRFIKELRQPYLAWWFHLSGSKDRQLNLSEESRDILRHIADERRASKKSYGDLLDMLLESKYDDGSSMDEEQLIDELLIIFIAGHETTSNVLTFTFQLLAKHPEWQEVIYQEFQQNKMKSNDLMGEIMASKNCQQVIEEAMRLFPPAYIIDRVNLEPDKFKDMDIPLDSNILIHVYAIHRHPDLWDNPNDFHPERFDEGGQKFSSQYFPFGAGPRKCIGNNFAMFEMILAVNHLVKTYKLYPEFDEIAVNPLITLKPKNGFLRFEKR